MEEETKKNRFMSKIRNFYDKKYKKLLIIPFLLLFLAIVQISVQTAMTGDFIHKGVSLKGGVTITIPTDDGFSITKLENDLLSAFPSNDVSVRTLEKAGVRSGVTIDADIDGTDKATMDSFVKSVEQSLNKKLETDDYSVEIIGSSLGKSFFKETTIAILIAFLFMGIVIFIYFRIFVPSAAVILAALSDIIVTLAIVNLMGMKISTAGIAAFLMLIGYSVDTDVLLSTRVLKRKEGSVLERIFGAMKTGFMMTVTTFIAVFLAYMFSQSDVIKQIMIILMIGLLVDLVNTWIQNAGLIRLYLEKKKGKDELQS